MKYRKVWKPEHPRNHEGMVLEHLIIAETALGKLLTAEHPVHHHDLNRQNNANTNLVICEDAKYHMLLHARARVLWAGGDPNLDAVCSRCKLVKPKYSFTKKQEKLTSACSECLASWQRQYRRGAKYANYDRPKRNRKIQDRMEMPV